MSEKLKELVELAERYHAIPDPNWLTFYVEAAKLLRHSVLRWRRVSEELPEEPGIYLVYRVPKQFEGGYFTYSLTPITARMFDGTKWESNQVVTHWMPLPEPPKEGKWLSS